MTMKTSRPLGDEWMNNVEDIFDDERKQIETLQNKRQKIEDDALKYRRKKKLVD